MINSALTLNQKFFAAADSPPNGLVGLPRPKLDMPNGLVGEETSCARRRRMSAVISSDPIQMRRVWSILMTLASACSCCGVQTDAGRAVVVMAAVASEAAVKRGRSG